MNRSLFKRVLDLDISILLIFLFILALGIVSFATIKITFMPRHSEPVLTILTDYYGMEPDIIEEIITRPIENLLKEVEGVQDFYSFTSKGRSRIVVHLNYDEDVDKKAVLIKDRIYHISDTFPREAQEPAIYKYSTDDRPVMILSLSSERYSLDDLSLFVEHKLKPQLLSIEGIANIELAGSSKDEYFIEQSYENLTRLKIDYETLFQEIVKNSATIPLGNMKHGNSLTRVTFPNKYNDLLSLPRHGVPHPDGLVFGYDLFLVEEKKRENERISFVNNEKALALYVFKRDFSNILEIDRGVCEMLEKWSDVLSYTSLHNQAERFRDLLHQLEIGVIVSVVCVFCIVLLFYRDISLSFLIVLTIPLSLAGTLSFLKIFSKSLNLMTLSGLIVGIGTCVDNAIIVIESTQRNTRQKTGETALLSSMAAVNRPILAATLTTIIVFLPLFSLNRKVVALYTDFALSVSLMLVISYFISLFFIPSFIKRFYWCRFDQTARPMAAKKGSKQGTKRRDRVQKVSTNFVLFMVKKALDHPFLSMLFFFTAVTIFGYLFIALEYEEISPLKEREYEVYFEFEPRFNTAYKKQAMVSIGEEISKLGFPITLVSKLDGTKATFFLRFPEGYKQYRDDIKRVKNSFSKRNRHDGFFYFQKGKESGVQSLSLSFFGDNLEKLNEFVDAVSTHVSGFYGVRQVLKGYKKGKPEIELRADPEKMYYHNLNLSDTIRFLRYVFHYPVIMKYFDGEQIIDVRGKIRLHELRKEDISSLRIPNEKGHSISLKDFASLRFLDSAGMVSRKNAKKYISLDIRYEGVKEDVMVNALRSFLKEREFEEDFYYEFDEELLKKREKAAMFLFTLCLALFMIYVLVGILLRSFRLPLIIIFTIPSLFAGSFLFLWSGGYGRSVPAHIALILLTGLCVNSTILLLEEVFRVQKRGARVALLLGYRRKMRLLMMTMLTTVFSLIPVFLLASSTQFFKILTGVIASGMFLSLIVSLGIFPVFYRIFSKEIFKEILPVDQRKR